MALPRATLLCALLACARAPSASPQGFRHEAFFIVAGSHQGFSCDQCHVPSAPGFALVDQGVTCTACHANADTTPLHTGIAGYAWSTGSCIACHKDGNALPPNHDTVDFPVTNTKHAKVRCTDCHGATKALADITCVPCHAQSDMASTHSAIPPTTRGRRDGKTYTNYTFASADCLTCHADGQVDTIASHPRFDHGLTGEGHAPFCLTCHTKIGAQKAWAADFSQYSCLACHSSNNPG